MSAFRRQKTLNDVAILLASKGYALNGSSGLDAIADSLAHYLGKLIPTSRPKRWEMLAEFIGHPAAYEKVWTKKLAISRERVAAKATKGAREDFFESREWLALRYQVLRERGAACECCGATRADGIVIQVDHIKPRSLFPALALVKSNLQVLCKPCNFGKSNKDQTDWRDSGASPLTPEQRDHLSEILHGK